MKSRKIKFFSIATVSLVVVAIAAYFVITKIVIPNSEYNSAVALVNEGKYAEAIKAFEEMNGYKDSAEKAKEIYSQHKVDIIRDASVGEKVFFGTYEQDNDTSNGKEDIEWIVLAKEDKRALVISKYALDSQPFNTSPADVTWETCSLREWLNGVFYDSAFSSEERNSILSSTVTADKNPQYSTSPGNDTTDKVFLLSIPEAEKYFKSDASRKCQGTAFCFAQGAIEGENGNCEWWLRTPGSFSYMATTVSGFGDGITDTVSIVILDLIGHDVSRVGSIEHSGGVVEIEYFAVRPAMWINLEA